MKTLPGLLALLSLALATPALADSHHGGGGYYHGGGYHGNYGHNHGGYRGGRYFYYGGLPYYYPYVGFGFGDPYWYGGGGGYYDDYYQGSIDDRYYGALRPYEGRIVDETSPARLAAQHGARSLPAAVQRQLAEKGYYKGGIDGQFGAASKRALKRFQADKDLKQTGLIDEATLKALGFKDR